MRKILIKNATVFSGFLSERIYFNHDIYIENGFIKNIFPSGAKKYKADEVIDVGNRLVMPGFVNTHMHFYSSLVNGIGGIKVSKDFIEVLKNLWWRLDRALDRQSTYTSAMIACLMAIKKGTTTVVDHHSSPSFVRGSLFTLEEVVRKCGLRACLCYEVSDRDGKRVRDEAIAENEDFIKHCMDKKDPFIKAMFGLHASFTLENDTLKKCSDIANSLSCGFHLHCAESVKDEEDCVKKYGMRVVERFYKYSITGPQSIFAHCVHVDEKEMSILKKTSTSVVLNPQSNANNAVGISDLVRFIKTKILTGIGTDAMTLNMLEEARFALWVSHLKNSSPSTGLSEVISALKNNVKIALKYFDDVGEIKEGRRADIVVFNYLPSTPMNESNFYAHLIFGVSQSCVRDVIVDKRVLMKDGKITFIDEQEVYAKSKEVARKLWSRV